MKATVVFANTYSEGYGIELTLFGVATNEDGLEKIKARVIEEGYIPQTKVLTVDEYQERYLGSYFE